MLLALDRAMPGGWCFDQDGRLTVAAANLTMAGVNPYRGREIPNFRALGLDGGATYRLLRHPAELEKAARTFNGVPLLLRHVQKRPDPADVVGTTGTNAVFAGPHVQNSIHVWARDAISGIESGARAALSAGYSYAADMTPGIFRGERFDGVMRSIVGHHVALVPKSRAGSDMAIDGTVMSRPPVAAVASFARRFPEAKFIQHGEQRCHQT